MKHLKIVLWICIFLAFLSSCQKDDNYSNPPLKSMSSNDMIIFGDEEPDPYNLDTMLSAKKALESNNISCPLGNITPTGTYVRVLSTSDEDYDILSNDTLVHWFTFPLNREIVRSGSYYWDETLPDTTYDWLYSVLPIGYSIPSGLTIDTLYPVFIPDDHPRYRDYEEYFNQLEEKSYELCGDTDDSTADNPVEVNFRGKWTPSATITVWDDTLLHSIALEGVRVYVKRSTKTSWAVTDASGYCTMSKQYRKKVTYWIEWERHFWKIVGSKNKLSCLWGPNQKGTWSKEISQNDGPDLMRATIHRAALIANYKNNLWPIQKPQKYGILFVKKIKIRYFDFPCFATPNLVGDAIISPTSPSYGDFHIVFFGRGANGQRRSTLLMFNRALHELAHWSHVFFLGESNYLNNPFNRFIGESWAQCVDWIITSSYYPSLFPITGIHDGYHYGYQDWMPSFQTYDPTRLPYTPIFIDLIDNKNQNLNNSGTPYDVISGYTLKEIQDTILPQVTDLASLRIKLKNHKLYNATNTNIDQLLEKYNNIPGF